MTNIPKPDGYIKFQCFRESENIVIPNMLFERLGFWRDEMYRLGLIGIYPNGIGFGNISAKLPENELFYISGSATGGFSTLWPGHYALVERCDFANNRVWCKGKTDASSETMSHAAIYRNKPQVAAVIHIHHFGLWEKSIDKLPTTSKSVEYGTPGMADEIARILGEMPESQKGVLVMGGHQEGLIAFGKTLEEAANEILQLL